MARRGAGVLREDTSARRGEREERATAARPAADEEVWVFEGVVEPPGRGRQAGTGRGRGATVRPPTARRPRGGEGEPALPGDVVEELANAVGRVKGQKLARRMAVAVHAYERDRYAEALRITRGLAHDVPESAAVHELHGLVCYRSGRWREAFTHLHRARALSGDDPSQVPILMDCQRALGRHAKVATLWEELRAASPPADVLVEGRLVLAADLADQGRLDDAVAVLGTAGAARNLRHPAERHLRQWYVLADLHERAGDVPRARELFGRVVAADPELGDAAERLAALGAPRRTPRPAAARRRGAPAPGDAAGPPAPAKKSPAPR